VRDEPPSTTGIFTYATGISLAAPERRRSRGPLVLVLMLTAGVAALVFCAAVWFATADFSPMFGAVRELLMTIYAR
jgi:hypothetical protein